ncbi:AraC family transcriptional regulator [uncultured Roseibium sp.]|uniref:helix-turn-helix domain-containing protein n=1 Tax=uncultured Roseibium sp. TaxID=1936171 RepID=UPI0026255F5B|nr:AraC family transcriptional regulator [uncultured Roseibium sp.]
METSQHLLVLISTMAMTVPLFAALCCLVQDSNQTLFRVLAAFFVAAAITELPTALHFISFSPATVPLMDGLWALAMASVMPLIWLYVWILTAEDDALPRRFLPHLLVPGGAILTLLAIAIYQVISEFRIFGLAEDRLTGAAQAINLSYWFLEYIAIRLQWGIYILLIYIRLVAYRSRLKDLFASTEKKELRWITVVIGIGASYWILSLISSLLSYAMPGYGGLPTIVHYVLNLIVQTIVAVWGLRQRPGLQPESDVQPVSRQRYANSALTNEDADRIAAKLRKAMASDTLYLDPNLSLWALARHTGVSENYISQVLNEEVGQNFFDFVNGYRIEAAKTRLSESDETILAIALEAGFNSRSSFYTAFKKVTGQTPTAYRKAETGSERLSSNLSV